MSSMLEQAVIDAADLREVALKNAEATIVEKYSHEVKDAMKTLLEQDEELEDFETDLLDAGAGTEQSIEDPALEDVPLAATDGEELCACPDETDSVVLALDDLIADVGEEEAALATPDELIDSEEFVDGLEADGLEIELNESELAAILQEDEEDAIEINSEDLQEMVDSIEERLRVDMSAQLSGWAGRPETEKAYEELVVLAQMQDTEIKAQAEKSKEAAEELKGYLSENTKLEEKITGLVEKNKKLSEAVVSLKEHVEKLNASNAKLLYTNRVLTSDSLNERQRNQIVEAISNSDTVEEAKVIFETLQSTVGNAQKRGPKSLSEAVDRTSTTTLPRKTRHSVKEEPAVNRWQLLAGLKK